MLKIHPSELQVGMLVETFDGPARVINVTWYAGSGSNGGNSSRAMHATLDNGHGIARPRHRRQAWIEILTA